MNRTSARRPSTLLLVTVTMAVFSAVVFAAGLARPLRSPRSR